MPALLIDLFGTLVKEGNDEFVHMKISRRLSQLVEGLNWVEHLRLYKALVDEGLGSGEAIWEALLRMCESGGLQLKVSKNEVLKLHVDYHARYAELYEDSLEALRLAKELFGKIALVSDSDPGIAEEILKSKGVRGFFDAVVVSGEVGVRKPDPRLFLEAARRVGASPKECVMVGDTVNDVEGAKAAGMRAVLLRRSLRAILKMRVVPDAVSTTLTEAVSAAYGLIHGQ